jgi:hypothetical protein
VRRAGCGLLFGIVALVAFTGCGNSSSYDESVGGVLEHFCRYQYASEDDEVTCVANGSERELHREEWGPRAQAVLYALGEVKGCLSKAGSRCETATWKVHRRSSLLVERYCNYGAKSEAQIIGCIHNVSPAEVLGYAGRQYATAAASYAVGDRTNCGYAAGPFCL